MVSATLEKIVLAPMQWALLSDIDEVSGLSDSDADCLSEIGEVLRRHQKTSRFGVNLLHKHFDINEGETLLETTDKNNRKLFIDTVSQDSISESIQTNWMFIEDKNTVTTWCTQRCGKDVWGNHTDDGHARV